MANITKAFTRSTSCDPDKTKQEHYDDALKGFLLEVRSNGRKTFFLRHTASDKKVKYIRIGDAAVLDADSARTKALKLKRSIEEGKDVIIDTPEPEVSVPTMKEFYEDQYIPFVKQYSKSWARNASCYVHHILPDLGNYPMDKITPPMIAKCHVAMIEKKKLSNGSANKYIIFLRHAYALAIEWKLEGVTDNPASKVKLYEERNRERFITPREGKKLMYAVKQSNNPYLKYIVAYLILTGARRSEVLRTQWADIDLTNRIWTIPITKNKKIRKVPISDELLELIQTIPKDSKYLFPTNTKIGHYTDVYRTWDKARIAAGLDGLRLHDLRHSFASMLVNSGRSLYEVQTLLGHSSIKMTQRYAHLSDESLHKAVSCAGKLLG